MTRTVILERKNPHFPCYLAQDEAGAFYAGTNADSAAKFPDAKAVWDFYYPMARRGSHAAWNLCYFAEDYIQATA